MTCTGGRLAAFAEMDHQLSVPRDVRRSVPKRSVMNRLVLLATVILALVGCSAQPSHVVRDTPSKDGETADKKTNQPTSNANISWDDQIGNRITLTGMAINRKIGAFLSGDRFGIYVDLDTKHWPSDLYHGGADGELVVVTGTVTQRSDLPVFVPEADAPSIQGIPVPKGTDLGEAAKRYILESVKWKRNEDGTEQNDARADWK